MPHPAHDEFETLTDADLVAATGGFVNEIMGAIGQIGGPKVQEAIGKFAPLIQSFAGLAGGGGG